MKTYLLSIPQRFKQQSAVLDVKTLLCNNAWDTINNEGQKQVLIFHNDGSMIVSTNGNVSMCEWKIEPLAGTIVISSKEHAEMFKAGMVQEILVLAKDGSNEVLSLIDSKNTKIIPNRTVNELTAYFNHRDRLIEEKLNQEKHNIERRKAHEDEKRKQEEHERLRLESAKQFEIEKLANFCQENKSEICQEYRKRMMIKIFGWVLEFLSCVILIIGMSVGDIDGWFMVLVIAAMNLIVYLPIILGYYLEEELFHTIKISPIIRIKYKCKYACEINLSDREITSIAGQFLQIITDY